MNQAIKLSRFSSQSPIFNSPYGLSSITSTTRGGSSVRFMQVNSNNNDPKPPKIHEMEKSNKSSSQQDQHLNVMEESFGEGYATRSDEEGFGGIYGCNDEDNVEMKIINDPAHHDSTQGSEVKEKERARNQSQV